MDPYPILQSEPPVPLKVSIPTGFELFEKSDLGSLVSRWRAWSWSVVGLLALDLVGTVVIVGVWSQDGQYLYRHPILTPL